MDTVTTAPPPASVEEEQATEEQTAVTRRPSDKTPQEFYQEITRRPDIRAILEELAKG